MNLSRLSLLLAAFLLPATLQEAHAVTIDMVPVGNAGNANDPATGNLYGGVNYSYQIGKYDVTIGQYTDFLNAVAATDTYSLYNGSMATDLNAAGISRSGTSGAYTYSVITNGGNSASRPITHVSWWDSARFSNWMANGQPTGAQSSTTTENGAYNLANWPSGFAPAKNVTNPNTSAAPTFFIPNENEWYKAAYFDPTLNSGSSGYYTYATQSNTAPGNQIGSAANQANYNNGLYSVTQSASYSRSQNYLTDVGAFSGSGSFYGTFDQSGNVYQWTDLDGTSGSSRGLRGGVWGNRSPFNLSSSGRYSFAPSNEIADIGFRLASPVAVPEPSTWVMGLAGMACGGWQMWRRRRDR